MAEGNGFSSQESLPLSEGTSEQLFTLLGADSLSNIMHNDLEVPLMDYQARDTLVINDTSLYPLEDNLQKEPQSTEGLNLIDWSSLVIPKQYVGHENALEQKRHVSSLPASENWFGPFSFAISFSPQTVQKNISWIFSSEKRKLYVDKNVPCPVNFSTNVILPPGVYIRAMALFSSSNQASEVVKQCINHSMDEMTKHSKQARHFIRCDSQYAIYENDPLTGRQSVCVPFENPPAGQEFSTYLFKFMCFGSCAGGPNRRALMVVFTLENRGEVIGRQKVDLKVCACPARDYKADCKKEPVKVQGELVKIKKPAKRPSTDQLDLLKDLPKKVKKEEVEKRLYCLKTRNIECYHFLKFMKKVFDSSPSERSKYLNLINDISSYSSCDADESN